ncbi:frizzled-10-B-like [Tachypleus tridentatus]|uniref:frizzled-10-B-like n=1 Tax=Tachypleus tridentatus TaxID=6853 RepID=UPI003FD0EBEC
MTSILLVTILYLTVITYRLEATLETHHKCERITIPMCQNMPYNMTRMPNFMGHSDQAEAAIRVHEYIPLVKIGCSRHLKFFLCSLYAPMCTEQVDIPIPSCQSICEEVKSKCLPVLQRFNFEWPDALNCTRLPVPQRNGLCMEYPNITEERHSLSQVSGKDDGKNPNLSHQYSDNSPQAHFVPRRPSLYPYSIKTSSPNSKVPDFSQIPSFGTSCPENFVFVPSRRAGVVECSPRCDREVFFTRKDKNFAEIWMGIFAAVCFMSTLFTVCTFWIDSARFRYPERPIIFLSMCFCIYSSAYLIRIFSGPESISCEKTENGEPYLIKEGLESTGCIIVFLLTYYFGMSAAVWWLALTFTWFLASAKKWGHEAIESRASYFHLLAWAVPGVLTIVVLTLRHVDGDQLTGMCYVGNSDKEALLWFVIGPLCVFFVLGATFIILGFASLLRIRKVMKSGGRNISKLERLMVRIGVFSVLYTIPALGLIACHWYEYSNRPTWTATAMATLLTCPLRDGDGTCRLIDSIPSEEIFMLKIFMSLLLGISTGVWIWSNKTWNSWMIFFNNKLHKKPRRNFKAPSVVYHTPHIESSKATCSRKHERQLQQIQVTRI